MKNASRITLAILLAALAQTASAGACDTKANAQKTVNSFDADHEKMRAKQKARETAIQGEIMAIKKRMVDTKRWTKKQSDAFMPGKSASKESAALEKRQLASMEASMGAMMSYAKHMEKGEVLKACPHTKTILDALALTGEANEKQFLYMLETTKAAAK